MGRRIEAFWERRYAKSQGLPRPAPKLPKGQAKQPEGHPPDFPRRHVIWID